MAASTGKPSGRSAGCGARGAKSGNGGCEAGAAGSGGGGALWPAIGFAGSSAGATGGTAFVSVNCTLR